MMRKKHSNDGKVMTKDDKEKGQKKKRKSNIRDIEAPHVVVLLEAVVEIGK